MRVAVLLKCNITEDKEHKETSRWKYSESASSSNTQRRGDSQEKTDSNNLKLPEVDDDVAAGVVCDDYDGHDDYITIKIHSDCGRLV